MNKPDSRPHAGFLLHDYFLTEVPQCIFFSQLIINRNFTACSMESSQLIPQTNPYFENPPTHQELMQLKCWGSNAFDPRKSASNLSGFFQTAKPNVAKIYNKTADVIDQINGESVSGTDLIAMLQKHFKNISQPDLSLDDIKSFLRPLCQSQHPYLDSTVYVDHIGLEIFNLMTTIN